MSITSHLSANGQTLQIKIVGRFDFSSLQAFTQEYQKATPKPQAFVLDFEECDFLDSSALRVLLALREYAGGDKSDVRIVNCSLDVKKILVITKLNELFHINF